jgi:hypothetical protein
MKTIIGTISILMLTFASSASWSGPITQISSLSPNYLTGAIDIQWSSSLVGGCTTSTTADTNPNAANHDALVAVLLAAFATGANVEISFGGGCGASNSNWIQTIRILQ